LLVTAGLMGMVRRDGGGARWSLIASGFALGLAMWTYPAARLVVPLLMVAWAIIAWRQPRESPRTNDTRNRWAFLLLGVIVGAAPMFVTLARHPEQLFARAQHVGLFATGSRADGLGEFFRQYAAHFDPVALFITGEGRALQYPP